MLIVSPALVPLARRRCQLGHQQPLQKSGIKPRRLHLGQSGKTLMERGGGDNAINFELVERTTQPCQRQVPSFRVDNDLGKQGVMSRRRAQSTIRCCANGRCRVARLLPLDCHLCRYSLTCHRHPIQ